MQGADATRFSFAAFPPVGSEVCEASALACPRAASRKCEMFLRAWDKARIRLAANAHRYQIKFGEHTARHDVTRVNVAHACA